MVELVEYDVEESATHVAGEFVVTAFVNTGFEEGYNGTASFSGNGHTGSGSFGDSTDGNGSFTMTHEGLYTRLELDYRDGESEYLLSTDTLAGDALMNGSMFMNHSAYDGNGETIVSGGTTKTGAGNQNDTFVVTLLAESSEGYEEETTLEVDDGVTLQDEHDVSGDGSWSREQKHRGTSDSSANGASTGNGTTTTNNAAASWEESGVFIDSGNWTLDTVGNGDILLF